MSAYMLLCNFTDQGIRTIKEVPKRRAAAQELGKKFGVDIKAGYLAIGAYDLIVHVESASDDAIASFFCRSPLRETCGRQQLRSSVRRNLTR
jgi:uncharacterized protein with GYD domain